MEDSDETDEKDAADEAGNTDDGDAADDMESDAASEMIAVYADEGEENPPSVIAESVKLVPSGDGVNAAAYSFNDTFTVVPGDDVDEGADLADSYILKLNLNEVKLKYVPDGTNAEVEEIDYIKLDTSNDYAKAICSSDLYYESEGNLIPLQLRPDTKYIFGYSLEWEAADEQAGGTFSDTITVVTAKANMSWYTSSEADTDNKLPITVKLDKDGSTANTADLKGQTVSLSAYLKENNEDAYNKLPDGPVEFTNANNYAQTINVDITELKPETTYEIALGVEVDGDIIVYDDFQFTTPSANGDEGNGEEGDDKKEDDREIKVTSVEPKVSSATIEYTASGSPSSDYYDYVICYYKAKDAESWTWGAGNYWWGGDSNRSFSITGLSSETAYEYKIGFGSYDTTPAADLTKPVQGDFKTNAEDRKVTATVEPKVTRAILDYTLSGGYSEEDMLYCFYKAKDTVNWRSTYYEYWEYKYEYESFEVSGLNTETTYDYKIGFASDYGATQDQLVGECAEGSFTTLADQRKLSDAQAEVVESASGPRIRLNALFSGNIEEESTYIYYFYREQAAAGTDVASAPAWNLDARDWTSSIMRYCRKSIMSGIEWGKTYEYAIVISDNYSLSSPDEVTKEDWKLTGKVEVPAAQAPTSIKLSKTDLYLNLDSYSGCDYQIIKADIAPAGANKALVCSTSNSSVANFYYYDGSILVYATGVGTAKITVKSFYSETVSAEINVEVANYAIFAKVDGSVDPYPTYDVSYPKFTDGKNIISKEEYLLYKVEESGATPVANYTVTSENESIVTWDADKRKLVTGKSVGSADLVFTDGKFEARLTVYTYAAAKAFAITGLISNSGYDAIEKDGVYTIAKDDYSSSYEAVVKFSPSSYYYDADDLAMFDWASSDPTVAIVDDGIITPIKAGDATITATAPENIKDINQKVLDPATIKIKVVDVPDTSAAATTVYVLANTVTKLSDVACPDGWEWKVPETPIVTNAVNNSAYRFDAVYTKGDKYPSEAAISVYIAQVTGMSVYGYGDSDAVLEVAKSSTDAENDSLILNVNTISRGRFDCTTKTNGYEDYQIEIPAVNGLSIERVKPQYSGYDENGLSSSGSQQFTIKAEKAGKYTLNPAIYVKDANGNRKQLAKASYKLTAVDAALAESIEIRLTEEAQQNPLIKTDDDDEGRLYIDLTPSNEIGAGAAESVQDFDVEAILKDWKDAAKTGELATTVTSTSLKDTKLTWKVSDAKVATVKADSANSQKAKVTVKGEGHTILTATAKDAAGHSAQLRIEIRNHAPRISDSKVNVNTAFDYDSYYGLVNAKNAAGCVEIIPVYGEWVNSVRLYENDTLSSSFKLYPYSDFSDNVYVIGPKSAGVSAGKYTVELRVTTDENKTYNYPIQVTVVNKPAKITVKSVNTVNLFYTDDKPEVSFNVSGTYSGISSVKWTDKSPGVGNGFSTNWFDYYDYDDYDYDVHSNHWYASQENISLNGTKLSDPNIVKGEFTVKLDGYRDAYKVPATIKWNYKKPSIVTYKNGKAAASTTIEPSAGVCGDYLYLYDKTNKRDVYYNDDDYDDYPDYYDDLVCNNKNVEMEYYDNQVSYWYTGSKTSGSEKIEFKLASNVWREDITVKHTIKLAKPTAALSVSQIVINTNKPALNSVYIKLKNSGSTIGLSDIKVEGKDAKSAKLLEDDLLEIINNNGTEDSYWIDVRQNDAGIMGKDPIKAGTYSYNLTPYYTDNSGNRQALNTVVLKVKVVNKEITVKTKVKNTLDLVKGTDWCNYMEITPAFSNIGTGYSVSNVKLTGEYSKYFTFDEYYRYSSGYRRLKISPTGVGKLKAGQSYKLTLVYTVSMPGGDTFTVTANPITVKPKQTAPKVKIYNNNQTIYAGEEEPSRIYRLETDAYQYKENGWTYTEYPYEISNVYGGLDCNKDGVEDISVSVFQDDGYECWLDVYIADRDGVLTATGAKGKTYNVPVTVTLRGRDGISKDVKTTIKVTIKR